MYSWIINCGPNRIFSIVRPDVFRFVFSIGVENLSKVSSICDCWAWTKIAESPLIDIISVVIVQLIKRVSDASVIIFAYLDVRLYTFYTIIFYELSWIFSYFSYGIFTFLRIYLMILYTFFHIFEQKFCIKYNYRIFPMFQNFVLTFNEKRKP